MVRTEMANFCLVRPFNFQRNNEKVIRFDSYSTANAYRPQLFLPCTIVTNSKSTGPLLHCCRYHVYIKLLLDVILQGMLYKVGPTKYLFILY